MPALIVGVDRKPVIDQLQGQWPIAATVLAKTMHNHNRRFGLDAVAVCPTRWQPNLFIQLEIIVDLEFAFDMLKFLLVIRQLRFVDYLLGSRA